MGNNGEAKSVRENRMKRGGVRWVRGGERRLWVALRCRVELAGDGRKSRGKKCWSVRCRERAAGWRTRWRETKEGESGSLGAYVSEYHDRGQVRTDACECCSHNAVNRLPPLFPRPSFPLPLATLPASPTLRRRPERRPRRRSRTPRRLSAPHRVSSATRPITHSPLPSVLFPAVVLDCMPQRSATLAVHKELRSTSIALAFVDAHGSR